MIFDVLEKNKELNQEAVVCGEDKISYSDLYIRSKELGVFISENKSKKIILFMPNGVNYVISYFGILYSGKVVYPISSKSKIDELISAVDQTETTTILCSKETYDIAKIMTAKRLVEVICIDELKKHSLGTYIDNEIRCRENYSVLLNTSGSTDIHKIVMLTELGILTNCEDWIKAALASYDSGRMLVAMPACTSFGTVVVTTCIMLGWTIVFTPSFFNSAMLLKTIYEKQITHLICIGSMLNILAKDIANVVPGNEYDSLRFIGIGGNKAVPETMRIMMKFFRNAGISPGYGITEATCIVTAIGPKLSIENKALFFEKIESAGVPFENVHVTIGERVDESTEFGEILVKGHTIMKGYYNNEPATLMALKDGSLHTGDIGYFDEDGYLFIVGRIKNIIKSGGYTVFPEEIEAVLQCVENVKEAYVYGVSDPILDEKIMADVVLINESDNSVEEIKEFCLNRLADYKVPEDFRIVKKIEKTKTGKINRKVHK